jgi:GntR family transcriptional regulator
VESVGDLMDLQLDTDSELIRALAPTVDPVAAEALGCPASAVHSLALLRSHAGTVFSRTVVHVPARIAGTLRGIEELTTPGLRSRYTVIGLIERRGTDVDEAEQTITAGLAGAQLAADLRCEVGIPVLHVERTYFDTRGGAVEYEVTDLLPELYSHQSRLRRRRSDGD